MVFNIFQLNSLFKSKFVKYYYLINKLYNYLF